MIPLIVSAVTGKVEVQVLRNTAVHIFSVKMESYAPDGLHQLAEVEVKRIEMACVLAATREISLINADRHR